ncbi:hypothetical protein ACI2JA_08970 [Alkalihalobacillus sp. NPDC078783]
MEELISTLLGSPLLIFFIIAIISFLGRMVKGAGQTNQQQGQNQPQQKQEESKEINWRDIFTQEEAKAEPQPRQQQEQEPDMVTDQYAPSQHREQETTQATNTKNELYDRLEEYKRRKRESEEQAPKQVQLSATSENRTHSSGRLDLSVGNLSKQDAMKAVVWAEVLGKPRAKNPHQAFAPTRRK